MTNRLTENSAIIESAIKAIIANERECCYSQRIVDAEEYSLLAGGKHIRGTLCLEFYKLFGGKDDISNIAACLELVHTFSLIHDDMPEMDNDDLRRGKASCHKEFDNATALLAGDGLAILPYKVISSAAVNGQISTETAINLIRTLSVHSGNEGMISGQMIDLQGEKNELTEDDIIAMYACKTVALIKCSCLFGGILADCNKNQLADISDYADNIGMVFQLVDDLLNINSTPEELGKPVGTDAKKNKNTFISHFGEEFTRSSIKALNVLAIESISKYEGSEFLVELVTYLSNRSK